MQKKISSKYVLIIRQQPQRAKVCGMKERDRRPIDPPPIIQIKLADPTSDRNKDYLQSPYLFMCCNIVHADDPHGEIVAPAHRALAGTVVSSLNRLKDVDNSDGGFFVFGDMSVRIEGRFCLRFTLFELIEGQVVHVMTTLSNPMTVHTSKTFPGMSESTFLSRSFSDQGVRIRIRKDHHVKPKKPMPNDTIDGSMHSPVSSSCDAEHSDNDIDSQHSSKRSRSSINTYEDPSSSSRHVAIASRPKYPETHYPSEPFDRSPPSSPHSFMSQDPAPSRPHHHPYASEQPYHSSSRSYGRQDSARPSNYHHSSAPVHAGHHGFPSALLNDQEMEHAPTHSRSHGHPQAPYHSRTPSMSSHHSDGNFSPPHPLSPTEQQMAQAQSPLPSIIPSRSSASEKIQLPPIHSLSTHSPVVPAQESGYGNHY
ncbi:hypothetical protein BGZ80_002230 [Entomortierella chlamydospora]|uniref:Velvet domain-containing protein n=1 Tax=Entomortierella chlamydospora TaxID=101097 RepID=A0A9P6MQ41_9FUNG|nr:hypothetical protein BGZ80_002230 [Entomortierella chlamydospora]